jgi:hypothetical protein
MATIKSYTTIEQSRKLAEILPFESADMRYHTISQYNQYPCDEIVYTIDFGKPSGIDIPCWSLAALLDVLPDYTLQDNPNGTVFVVSEKEKPIMSDDYDNPVDACVAMIEKLNELNLL